MPELVAPAARARPVISEPCPSYGLTVRAETGGFLPRQPGAGGGQLYLFRQISLNGSSHIAGASGSWH